MRSLLLKIRPKTFRGQLVLVYTTLLLVILIITFSIFYWSLYYWSYAEIDDRLRDEHAEMVSTFQFNGGRFIITNLQAWKENEHTTRGMSAYFVQVFDTNRTVIVRTENVGQDAMPFPGDVDLSRRDWNLFDRIFFDQECRALIEPIYMEGTMRGWVYIVCFSSIQSFLAPLRAGLIFSVIIAFVLAIGGGITLSNRSLQPLQTIINTLKEISHQNLRKRIPTSAVTNQEIVELSNSLNSLFGRLEDAFQRITQFTSNASHEMQTPLTVIKDEIEVTMLRERTIGEYEQALQKILSETEHMIRVIQSLLILARADHDALMKESELIDLSMILRDECLKLQHFAEQKRQIVSFHPEQADELFLVHGDDHQLRQIFRNLFMNAVQYSHEYGTIDIELEKSAQRIRVTVSDTGIGIPPEEADHIFDRFYRVQNDEPMNFRGSGLGLSIVRMLVDLHGGKISIESHVGRGTRVLVDFPRAEH